MDGQSVVQYAAQVAEDIERQFADSPLAELRLWVRLAHQREAMVSELYQLSDVDERLRELPSEGPGAVVRYAVVSIWAHEESHTRFLSTIRGASEATAWLTELQGRLEGKVTRSVLAGSTLGRALIALGASLDRVPEFATQLQRMTLEELLEFQGELETTARTGYERMLTLLARLADDAAIQLEFGPAFSYDIGRILCEERFHEDVFSTMPRWVGPHARSRSDLSPDECARTLHDLAERNLSITALAQLRNPGMPLPKGDPDAALWVSDGGLGRFFETYGLRSPVLTAEQAIAKLGG
jgi:hypothetical protein